MNRLNKRPGIRILRDFANRHYPDTPLTIKWKKMDKKLGEADLKNKIVYLSTKIPIDCKGLSLTRSGFYFPNEKLVFESGEQYFHVLLHEIGHFKVKWEAPVEYTSIKDQLEEDWPNDLEAQVYEAGTYLKRGENESDGEWEVRIFSLESWLLGCSDDEHILVEEWANKEFKKHREEIRRLLNQ